MVVPAGTETDRPLIFKFTISISVTPLLLADGAKLTFLKASAALETLGLIDHMGCLDLAGDSAGRAHTRTQGAAFALVRVDLEGQQVFADAGRTSLLLNMCLILIPEIPQGREDGGWGQSVPNRTGRFP